MLKTRIIPTLLYKDHGLVKGISFNSWRRIGTALPAIKVYNVRQVDELIFADITASSEERTIDFEVIDSLADECFMPMTVGGGIKSIGDIRKLLRAGADKVAINTGAIRNPELISQASAMFGAQCIVISIDVKKAKNGDYMLCSQSGTIRESISPFEWARKVESLGAGEILLTSVDRDGTMSGYDIPLIRRISGVVSIPVIASGGAGNYEHMAQAVLKGKASAIAAASIFHFTQQTPIESKQYLAERGIPTRL
jgi:cyclase